MYVTSLVCAMCATSIVSLLCLTAAPATADPALEGWSAATRGMVPQCDVVLANAHDRAAGKFWLTRELSLWSRAAVGDCTIVMLSTRAKDQVECVGVVAVKSVRWPPHPLTIAGSHYRIRYNLHPLEKSREEGGQLRQLDEVVSTAKSRLTTMWRGSARKDAESFVRKHPRQIRLALLAPPLSLGHHGS